MLLTGVGEIAAGEVWGRYSVYVTSTCKEAETFYLAFSYSVSCGGRNHNFCEVFDLVLVSRSFC